MLAIQGDGTTTDAWTTPVSVVGLPEGNVTSISVGDLHACAVIDGRSANGGSYANSTAWCWGYNANGQLGDGTTTDRSVAVKVKNLAPNVTSVYAGSGLDGAGFTCALLAGGSVKSWGNGAYGSRGDGSSVEAQSTPVSVQGLENVVVTQLSLGYYFALALTSDGEVYGWGKNDFYQLGDGTSTDRATAVEASNIPDGYTVTSVSAGYRHASFREADGGLASWGEGSYGEFGNGASTSSGGSADLYFAAGYEDTLPPSAVPTAVPIPAPTALPTPVPTTNMSRSTFGTSYAGAYTAHVVDDDGGIWYAGYCYQGRCGDGQENSDSATNPVYDLTRIAGINNVAKLDQNTGTGIALTGGGAVWYVFVVQRRC